MMTIELHSRVQRIGGNGVGYRDIIIHEMTESEIQSLREQRWVFPLIGMMTGATITFFAMVVHFAGACR